MSETNVQTHHERLEPGTKPRSSWGELGRFLILAVIIIVPIRFFVAEPFIVSGCSMFPTFDHREYLVIDKFTYKLASPSRGDVIVFRFPLDESQYFIKRIIALPGETIKLERGGVVVQNSEHPEGFTLAETYLQNTVQTSVLPKPVTLGKDEYFVMGDNRIASRDSREWGVLPDKEIVGKALVRIIPVNRFKVFNAAAAKEAAPNINSEVCKF